MYIGLTPELQALRDELRDYYAQLLTPEVEDELSHSEGVGPVARRIWKQMAGDGWAGIGWPTEYGGQGRSQIEQFIFFDESMRAGAPVPMLTINSVAPDDHAVRLAGAEGLLPAQDPRGRDPLLHRVHRARLRHRPRVAAHPRRARRRRVRDQRPEDLHEPRHRRRLRLARGAHRPEREEAQGHLDHHRPHRHARLQVRADLEHGRLQHQRHLLRGRPRPGRQPRRRGEPGLEPHHQPAQPRAGHAVRERHRRAPARGHDRVGQAHEARRRPAGDRPGVGAAQPRPGARPARLPAPRQLEDRRRRHARRVARPGRGVGDQGVRHRVLPRGVPAADGDPRAGRAR